MPINRVFPSRDQANDRAEEPISGTRTALLDLTVIGVGEGPGVKVGVSVSVTVGLGVIVDVEVSVGMGVKVDVEVTVGGTSVGVTVGELKDAQPLIMKTRVNNAIS